MWRSRKPVSTLVLSALVAVLLGLLLPASPANASGDDYPWRTDTTQTADNWGFTKRQCVSFVAFRMYQSRHPISNGSQHWGSGYHWDDAAKALGKRVTTTPKVGAVAQWNAGESSRWTLSGRTYTMTADSRYGHVAYVRAVYSDGTVALEQYNMGGTRSFSTMRAKAPRYIYVF